MDLTRTFTSGQFARALESWDWIEIGDKEPIFASPFGDIFFRAEDGYWWLDTLEAMLTCPWEAPDALTADLNTAEGQDRYLLAGLALGAERQGVIPGAHQVFGFKTPPVLGGAISVENIEAIDFVVSVNMAGQLHQQLRNLPPGTPITGFSFDPDR